MPSSSSATAATIVVVAKTPVAGQSKTRLIPALGPKGSAVLAQALLLDVLTTVTAAMSEGLEAVDKILLYAPPTQAARDLMRSLLQEHDLADAGWTLEPVDHSEYNKDDAHDTDDDTGQNNTTSSSSSSHLTVILRNALRLARQRQQQQQKSARMITTHPTTSSTDQRNTTAAAGTVVFLGMDCPEVPVAELRAAVTRNSSSGTTTSEALLCPAADGGYGMLAVSSSLSTNSNELFGCFDGVPWSHPLTAVAQLKALTDAGCCVTLGPLMHDIDTPEDVTALCERLSAVATRTVLEQQQEESADDESCLRRPSAWVAATVKEDDEDSSISQRCAAVYCQYTKQALKELGRL